MNARKSTALVLSFILLMALGCKDGQVRKASKAADDIASGLAAVQSTTEALYDAKLVSKDEARNIVVLVGQSTQASDVFIQRIRSLKNVEGDNKVQLVVWFDELSVELAKLNSDGVLHVKNPEARARLEIAFSSIHTGLTIIRQLLEAK